MSCDIVTVLEQILRDLTMVPGVEGIMESVIGTTQTLAFLLSLTQSQT